MFTVVHMMLIVDGGQRTNERQPFKGFYYKFGVVILVGSLTDFMVFMGPKDVTHILPKRDI